MKLIRELRMGPAKAWKTGAVVSTYPRPLLVLNFDQEGLDVIKEPIINIEPDKFAETCKLADQPPLSVVDFCDTNTKVVLEAFQPQGNGKPFKAFVDTANHLVRTGCPWKTVVLDSLSGLSDVVLAQIAATNSNALASALKWAPMIGGKIHQIMGVLTSLNCNVVIIAHSTSPSKQEETTGEITVNLIAPSQWLRDRAGTLMSQYFYQCKEGGKPVLYTTDSGYVKGLGCRWPENLPTKVGPTFKDIYERTPSK